MHDPDHSDSDPLAHLAAQVERLADLQAENLGELAATREAMRESVDSLRAEVEQHREEVALYGLAADRSRALIALGLRVTAVASAVALIAVTVVGVRWWMERGAAERDACLATNRTNAGVVLAVDRAVHEVAEALTEGADPETVRMARAAADRAAEHVRELPELQQRRC